MTGQNERRRALAAVECGVCEQATVVASRADVLMPSGLTPVVVCLLCRYLAVQAWRLLGCTVVVGPIVEASDPRVQVASAVRRPVGASA